jgi:hypothetical protein
MTSFFRFVTCGLLIAWPLSASAQQPFSFVITAPERGAAQTAADRVTAFAGRQLDPLVGVESRFGRITLLGLEDARFDRIDSRHARQTEVLVRLSKPSAALTLAAGSGIRREGSGVDVLLTRLVVEKTSDRSRLSGNVVIERPLSGPRDAMDVMTTVGWTRRVSQRVHVGLETLAQDMEGLWDPNEADGGAHIFLGPTVELDSPGRNWTFHVTAGADIRASQTDRSSDALRALGQSGVLMRIGMTRVF